MKILLINKFVYPKGGDAICTLDTGKLLAAKGHDVQFWGMDHPFNPDHKLKKYFINYIDYEQPLSWKDKLGMSINIIYSFEARQKIRNVLQEFRPDIVHLNNFAHQISPSILDVFKKENIPVVMTMHDYKLVCPVYTMLLHGQPCMKCKNGQYYQCQLNKCTKGSLFKSMVNVLEMYLHHKILNIYDIIDCFISPSQFLKNKVNEMGFKRPVVHLPNFIILKDYKPEYGFKENSICYLGRLSEEKGLLTLIKAVKGLKINLKIIGDGPLKKDIYAYIKKEKIMNIRLLGYLKSEKLKNEIRRSMAVILPSECYENNPKSIIEAFALGKPVIGSKTGGIPELVRDGKTGFTFKTGDIEDLRKKIMDIIKNKNGIIQMGRNARKFVEKNYDSDVHYKKLMEIYESAIKKHKKVSHEAHEEKLRL